MEICSPNLKSIQAKLTELCYSRQTKISFTCKLYFLHVNNFFLNRNWFLTFLIDSNFENNMRGVKIKHETTSRWSAFSIFEDYTEFSDIFLNIKKLDWMFMNLIIKLPNCNRIFIKFIIQLQNCNKNFSTEKNG